MKWENPELVNLSGYSGLGFQEDCTNGYDATYCISGSEGDTKPILLCDVGPSGVSACSTGETNVGGN